MTEDMVLISVGVAFAAFTITLAGIALWSRDA